MNRTLTKSFWIDLAEVIDSLRLFPRQIVWMYAYMLWYVTDWYTRLPQSDRTVDTTAFIGTVYGIAAVVIKFYLDGGRNWDHIPKDQS